MPVSRLDVIYRKIVLSKFFRKGWGSPDHMYKLFDFRKLISNRETCFKLVPKEYPIEIINVTKRSDCRVVEGKFKSPFAVHLPGLVRQEVEDSYFQMILPLKWKNNYKPVCIHLAGTGDHYFWRRRNIMAKPLLKDGIGAIILENPFYGVRKPKDQQRSSVHYVSDIFIMGGCLILECLVLLNWCEKLGLGPLGITGISMGGHMASLAASNWPKPLVLVPCLSWSTASSVFTEGVMSESIDWDMLQYQYESNNLFCYTLSRLCKIVDNPFACDLSKPPETSMEIPIHLLDDSQGSCMTPYQLINFLNLNPKCQDVPYRKSSQTVIPKEFSLMDFLMPRESWTVSKSIRNAQKMRKRYREALWFMRGIMDECTHLKNFSVPFDTSLIISICAKYDGYVPRTGVSTLEDLWPGATVKYVECGHVGAYVWHRNIFRQSIKEAFDRAMQKMEPPLQSYVEI